MVLNVCRRSWKSEVLYADLVACPVKAGLDALDRCPIVGENILVVEVPDFVEPGEDFTNRLIEVDPSRLLGLGVLGVEIDEPLLESPPCPRSDRRSPPTAFQCNNRSRRCSPRTGTDSGSGISTLSTSEYAQEMPSSLSAPVSDLDPPDVKDGQRR